MSDKLREQAAEAILKNEGYTDKSIADGKEGGWTYWHRALRTADTVLALLSIPERDLGCPPSPDGSSGKIDQPEQQAAMWQPIDTAPNDGTDILIIGSQYKGHYRARPPIVAAQNFTEWGPGWFSYDDIDTPAQIAPTHWMPLPPPPSGLPEGGSRFPEEAVQADGGQPLLSPSHNREPQP